jgi:hypothetical protein
MGSFDGFLEEDVEDQAVSQREWPVLRAQVIYSVPRIYGEGNGHFVHTSQLPQPTGRVLEVSPTCPLTKGMSISVAVSCDVSDMYAIGVFDMHSEAMSTKMNMALRKCREFAWERANV